MDQIVGVFGREEIAEVVDRAVQHITETEAVKEIEAALAKGPRRGPKPAEGEADTDEETAVEEEAA